MPISLSFNTKTLTEHCVAAIKFISRGLRRRSLEGDDRRQKAEGGAVMMCLGGVYSLAKSIKYPRLYLRKVNYPIGKNITNYIRFPLSIQFTFIMICPPFHACVCNLICTGIRGWLQDDAIGHYSTHVHLFSNCTTNIHRQDVIFAFVDTHL